MKNKQEILKKICGKNGHKQEFGGMCFCDVYQLFIFRLLHEFSLLGFLKSKDTLIKVFGEEDTCSLCGGNEPEGITINTDYGTGIEHDAICKKCGATWIDKAEFSEEGFVIPAYEWHHNQMGYDVIECLEYYGRYLL